LNQYIKYFPFLRLFIFETCNESVDRAPEQMIAAATAGYTAKISVVLSSKSTQHFASMAASMFRFALPLARQAPLLYVASRWYAADPSLRLFSTETGTTNAACFDCPSIHHPDDATSVPDTDM